MKAPRVKIPHPRDMALGARIKQVRKARKITRDFISRELGISVAQVEKYETAESRVSWSRFTEIAKALDISIPDLQAPLLDKDGNAKG